jgi:hypothetical protein
MFHCFIVREEKRRAGGGSAREKRSGAREEKRRGGEEEVARGTFRTVERCARESFIVHARESALKVCGAGSAITCAGYFSFPASVWRLHSRNVGGFLRAKRRIILTSAPFSVTGRDALNIVTTFVSGGIGPARNIDMVPN